jgi:hypothetical protein
MTSEEQVNAICKDLADRGKIIEAGFMSLKLVAIPKDASETQLKEMRNAFFAGAQHLFGSIMSLLEGGEDATASDIRRLSLINKELDEFIAQFTADNLTSGGRA